MTTFIIGFGLNNHNNIQLSHHLNQRLMYGKGERDMILMRHEVTIRSGITGQRIKFYNTRMC